MADAGWYDDPGGSGRRRWWDGHAWTAHLEAATPATRAPSPPPPPPHGDARTPPAAQPRLRADGRVGGPALAPALATFFAGVALAVIAAVIVVPDVVDTLSGPRFSVPGAHTLDLDRGTWVLYERTGSATGGGGVTFETDRSVSIRPEGVQITGPAPVRVRSDVFGGVETIDVGSASYTGAVRFDIVQAGQYRIEVREALAGEVLVTEPVTDIFQRWPWFLAGLVGGLLVVAGVIMWLVGAANRRTARRAGMA